MPVSNCQGAVVGINRPHPCPIAFKLLQQLKVKIEALPNDIAPPAQLDHPLAAFSGDPVDCVQGGFEDDWEEVLNPRMKQAFGWGEGSDKVERDFVQRGDGPGWFSEICGVLCGVSWITRDVDRDKGHNPSGRYCQEVRE